MKTNDRNMTLNSASGIVVICFLKWQFSYCLRIVPLIVLLLFSIHSTAQIFTPTSGVPVDLDAGTTNYISCSSTGNKCNIQFNVSGVGTLSATKALTKVNIQFGAGCGGNLRDVALYLKSPAGTCMRIYNGGTLGTSYSGTVNFSMRDGACLNEPNSSNYSTSASSNTSATGHYGAFDANSSSDMATVFNGQNANGTWTIYGFESATSAPCVNTVSLEFGDPTVADKTTEGEACSSAILWSGAPICASTNGKSSSALMPGSLSGGTTFGTIDGTTCAWNGNNNNDAWIRFVPNTSGNTCVSISGLDFNLQSIVVTDKNADGDNNPCTYTGAFPSPAGNDPRWTVVSCPRSAIYGTTAGSALSQQHCFTATAGTTYFLVVDGNGGAESSFYVTGTLGAFTPLPVTLLYFTGKNSNNFIALKWQTASETNNAYFEIERSENAVEFITIGKVAAAGGYGSGAEYAYEDKDAPAGVNYYRLKQTDIDGSYSYSPVIAVNKEIATDKPFAYFYAGEIHFANMQTDRQIAVSISDINGQIIYRQQGSQKIDVQFLTPAMYYISIETVADSYFQKIVVY